MTRQPSSVEGWYFENGALHTDIKCFRVPLEYLDVEGIPEGFKQKVLDGCVIDPNTWEFIKPEDQTYCCQGHKTAHESDTPTEDPI